jgi:hypothetical protein
LHWNLNLFKERFVSIFEKVLNSYDFISCQTRVLLYSRVSFNRYLQEITEELEEFKNISLNSSQSASKCEAITFNQLEHLTDGLKVTFSIENYLGGIYYLTADKIFIFR